MSLDPTNAILFGSADSLDRDTLYPVELLPDPHTCKQLCSQASENRNLVVLQDGVVAETYKGLPDETNNALWTTYDLHSQAAPNPVCRSVRRIVPLKVVRATRMILSLLTRTQYRQAIKTALSSFNQYERQQVLASIDFRTLELPSDSWKSIAFQLAQTICLIESDEFYTKSDLQQGLPDLADWIARRPGSLAAINDARDRLLQQVDGVYVRQKGDLNLFMYGNALAIDDWNQFARQCRGMIIDMRRERCVHFPMDKFFRFGEGPELDRQHFSDNLTTEIVEKLDGSMVSLFEHQGRLEFSCKGNFDTAQSDRAWQIAQRMPLEQLRTDRYWHVFEVIYPENRFPSGLSIVDYGGREEIVLISMRDRLTNELLPYRDLIAEAQRLGISHPRVLSGSLQDAFAEVDQAEFRLGHEGYVIRIAEWDRYVKLKYPAYKEVLRVVNEMRSDRFVRELIALARPQRATLLATLPDNIRQQAQQQLDLFQQIIDRIRDYSASVRRLAGDDHRSFVELVQRRVPPRVHRIIFQEHRGLDATDLLEKLALEVYYGKAELPEIVTDEIAPIDKTIPS